jgi:hypothetical protein
MLFGIVYEKSLFQNLLKIVGEKLQRVLKNTASFLIV